jgi:hypothetical protein
VNELSIQESEPSLFTVMAGVTWMEKLSEQNSYCRPIPLPASASEAGRNYHHYRQKVVVPYKVPDQVPYTGITFRPNVGPSNADSSSF